MSPVEASQRELQQRSGFWERWPRLADLLCLLLVGAFAYGAYEYIISYWSFGPEYASFWYFNQGAGLQEILTRYQYHWNWYRPTAFYLPYWFGSQFLDWHNLAGWKAFNLATAVSCSFLIYWLVQILFGRKRLAGVLAALYFILHPTLYLVIFEVSAFDFAHIFFGLLTGCCYLSAVHSRSWRSVLWTLGAMLAYFAALTSKEITVVVPGFLAIASTVAVIEAGDRRKQWKVELARLLPFVVLMASYLVWYMSTLPKNMGTSEGAYRTGLNLPLILENAVKYPIWMLRIFGGTRDSATQAAEFANYRNSLIGLGLAVTALGGCLWSMRRGQRIWPFVLLLGWIAVFLVVPVYSGGYLWHANLAMTGYAAIAGFGLSYVVEQLPSRRLQASAAGVLLLGMFLLARVNVKEFLFLDGRRPIYRMIYHVMTKPPVPADGMKGQPLVLVEDSGNFGWWAYGGGTGLIRYVYKNPKIQEKVTPPLDRVPEATCKEWFSQPQRYFLRYDPTYRWFDASTEFQQHCESKLR
jgi:hypothetical protein